MKYQYDIVAIGDVNLDFVAVRNLPIPFCDLVENGGLYWEDIDEIPGGSGLNFCLFSRSAGYKSLLLSKVGEDFAGKVITEKIRQEQIAIPPHWVAQEPTGKALIIRDNADIRLLVNNKKNANHVLSLEDVNESKDAIMSCQVLYVSGYAVSDPESSRHVATLKAMEYAKSSPKPAVVVFDVVPHRIYEKFTFAEFRLLTQNVDILISGVATMDRFLGLGSKTEAINDEMAKKTVEQVSQFYDRLILRYGASGCDYQILLDKPLGRFQHGETGHCLATDKRGFGDRLALDALHNFFGVLK